MKLKDRFPNFTPGLMYFIEDKNPVLAANDSKLYSFFIPLANFKKGFDYYELKPHSNGAVYFSITTMLGLKTIATTTSELYTEDLSLTEWGNIVGSTANKHFFREEYQALKRGYVPNKGGCMSSVLLTTLIFVLLSIYA